MPLNLNFFSLLKVPKDATPEEIRKAYFDAARRMHPDANPDQDAPEQFIKIQEAYEVLSNPERRASYLASLGLQEPVEPAASVNMIYYPKKLGRVSEPQLLYVLLELISTAKASQDTLNPLNICLVLDRSTSMQGERLDNVKSNALYLLRQLSPEDYFSVVSFSDRAEVVIPSMRGAHFGKTETLISMMKAGGGTEILRGLETGLNEVRRNLSSKHINHLILLTDGRTYGDEEACLRLARKAASEGISITGLGIGDEWNDAFLDKLAGCSGGSSAFISAPKDLRKHLNQQFNLLSKVYAESVSLELGLTTSVDLKYAFRLTPDPSLLPIENPLRLGNLIYSKTLTILMEFLVKGLPSEKNAILLANGKITMEIPSWTVPDARLTLKLGREIQTAPIHEAPHAAIVQALSRLTLYRMQEKARQEVAEGQVANATRHLQSLATHLVSQGERELAKIVLDEAENLKKSKHFSSEGDKRIKYGTRRLMALPEPGDEVK